jgi:hypothetical protein
MDKDYRFGGWLPKRLNFYRTGLFFFFFQHTITPIFGYTYDPTMETFNCYRLFAAIARTSFVFNEAKGN